LGEEASLNFETVNSLTLGALASLPPFTVADRLGLSPFARKLFGFTLDTAFFFTTFLLNAQPPT
jgi:hypothetical protein